MKKSKIILIVFLCLSMALNIILSVTFIKSDLTAVTVGAQSSSLRITVKDAVSGKVLEGATICIPETKSYYKTNSDGLSGNIPVPYIQNDGHERILPRNFGDITVLVYLDGYVDYLIFYIMTEAHSTRFLKISLYPAQNPNDKTLHTIIESPSDDWAKQIRDKYKK